MVVLGGGLGTGAANSVGDGIGDGDGAGVGCIAALTHSKAVATFRMPPEMHLTPAVSPTASFTGCARLVDLMQRMTCAAVAVGNALRLSSAAAATWGVACKQRQQRCEETRILSKLSHTLPCQPGIMYPFEAASMHVAS
jgi:hypothetical protein